MLTFEQGGWVVEIDPEATASVYSAMTEPGFAERCSCVGCRNFTAVRERVFAAEVRAFLSSLGVDSRKESDVTQCAPPVGPLYPYSGWFNVVGRILSDPGDVTALNDRFRYYFVVGSAGEPDIPTARRLRLEFELLAPWAILEPAEPWG